MNQPKKHHFVPTLLLKRFADEDGLLWYYDKAANKPMLRKGPPSSMFYWREYNSIKRKDGAHDRRAEIFFSQLENYVAPILEKICTSVRKGTCPEILPWGKGIWNQFLYYQWKRSPDTQDNLMSMEELHSTCAEIISEAENEGLVFSEEEKESVFSPEGLEGIRWNARVQAIFSQSEAIQSTLGQMGLCIAAIRKPNKSFIIGSQPVVKLTTPNKTRLGEDGVELWLPISYDIAISPMPSKGIRLVNDISDADIRSLNLSISRQSSKIASKSKKLIESIMCSR